MLKALFVSRLAIAAMVFAGGTAATASLDSLKPARQRVGELITLRGSGFGVYTPGVSKVVFQADQISIDSGMPYVWRDGFIQVPVPTGQRIGGINVPLPRARMEVRVIGADSESNRLPFQLITGKVSLGDMLPYNERTSIVSHRDVSTFLGSPNLNLARTKDADFADVNGDGWVDLVDNNSNNDFNSTHGVLRLNQSGQGFDAMALEPVTAVDVGDFAATVLFGGDYVGNATTYDADFVDLNNDGLPDYVQTAVSNLDGNRLRVLMNNYQGVPGRFLEQTEQWTGGRNLPNCPDDIAHTDVNNDGWIDVAVCLRSVFSCGSDTSSTEIFLNQGGTSFADPIILSAPSSESSHDVFFLDANADGHKDVIVANETGNETQLFMNDRAPTPGFSVDQTFNVSTFAGEAADLNGDGLDDFVISGSGFVGVYRNDPDNPGTFSQLSLPGASSLYYDTELGDVDLNGAIDVMVAAITDDGGRTVELWLNNGDATFIHVTPGDADGMFPGIANYQRLSTDLLDFDRDGDLDLYLTGADGQDVGEGEGFGRAPNQFFGNAQTCPGDVDGALGVGFGDLLEVLSFWGPCGACAADLNGDGFVTFADLLIVLSNWGECAG